MKDLVDIIDSLPQPNRNCFGLLLSFLKEVHEHRAENDMTADNLATCFVLNIMCKIGFENETILLAAGGKALSLLISENVQLSMPFREVVAKNTKYIDEAFYQARNQKELQAHRGSLLELGSALFKSNKKTRQSKARLLPQPAAPTPVRQKLKDMEILPSSSSIKTEEEGGDKPKQRVRRRGTFTMFSGIGSSADFEVTIGPAKTTPTLEFLAEKNRKDKPIPPPKDIEHSSSTQSKDKGSVEPKSGESLIQQQSSSGTTEKVIHLPEPTNTPVPTADIPPALPPKRVLKVVAPPETKEPVKASPEPGRALTLSNNTVTSDHSQRISQTKKIALSVTSKKSGKDDDDDADSGYTKSIVGEKPEKIAFPPPPPLPPLEEPLPPSTPSQSKPLPPTPAAENSEAPPQKWSFLSNLDAPLLDDI